MNLQSIPSLAGIELVSISDELQRFRCKLESEAGCPIEQMTLNAAELLSDLIVHLGLGTKQHDQILGETAVEYLATLMDTKVSLCTKASSPDSTANDSSGM